MKVKAKRRTTTNLGLTSRGNGVGGSLELVAEVLGGALLRIGLHDDMQRWWKVIRNL